MMVQSLLKELLAGRDLSADDMQAGMREIMEGAATPAQIAGFLVALRFKGETVTEIAHRVTNPAKSVAFAALDCALSAALERTNHWKAAIYPDSPRDLRQKCNR